MKANDKTSQNTTFTTKLMKCPRILAIALLGMGLAPIGCGADDSDNDPFYFDVPLNGDALFSYLTSTGYASFTAESALDNPMDDITRTFVNPTLQASLEAGNKVHPRGSASVKELYLEDGTTLFGWGVMVKTSDESLDGQGWYWYQIFSTTDGSRPEADGHGVESCVDCHRKDGIDFFLTELPLR